MKSIHRTESAPYVCEIGKKTETWSLTPAPLGGLVSSPALALDANCGEGGCSLEKMLVECRAGSLELECSSEARLEPLGRG